MSWASRRRAVYIIGIILFLAFVFGPPIFRRFNQPPTCNDGIQNQGETAPDKGGPCPILDERTLAPSSILWARSFKVRDGFYSSVAYIENPNENAGIRQIRYHFGLYDSRNVFVAEREGVTFVTPGGITPVFEANINTGNRDVAHTYFEYASPPTWERLRNSAANINITNKIVSDTETMPRIEATAENISVAPVSRISFVAVAFDPAGNARATSKTQLAQLSPGGKQQITFTWPEPFGVQIGRTDIIPLLPPASIPAM